MRRLALVVLAAAAAGLLWLAGGWWLGGPLEKDTEFTVPKGVDVIDEAATR